MVTSDKVIKAAKSVNLSIASLLNLQSASEGDVPDHLVGRLEDLKKKTVDLYLVSLEYV